MDIIDDQGNLFGLVNVVDAIVGLLVAAVIVAGVAFVLQPDPDPSPPPETATRLVTIDLGTPPSYLIESMQLGDTHSATENDNLTIKEIYTGPHANGIRTYLVVEISGVVTQASFTYDGSPLRLGRTLSIQTDTYEVSGTILSLGDELRMGSTQVLINSTVDAATAAEIQEGDTYSIGDREVATVDSVRVFATENADHRRVFVRLSLRTVDIGNGPEFGGTVLRRGATIPVKTEDYVFTGRIRQVGTDEFHGVATTLTVTLEMKHVPPFLSEAIRTGMTETSPGQTTAIITDIERVPAPLVVVDSDGTVLVRDHPIEQDLTLIAELTVQKSATGTMFKGETIQRGSTIVLNLGNVTVKPTVTSLRAIHSTPSK